MNLVGAQVGNYVVQRELGAGGMGTVYLAEHRLLGRQVAIKVLHDEQAADTETVARFFQEAKAAAEVGHENIIEVIDFGEVVVQGWRVVYLMMELLDGESLGKRLRQGPMRPDEAAHVVLQACAALSACHAKGIIHRDLKPENLHLCPRAHDPMFVKVLDFGIAKLTTPGKASAKTRIGTVLGTPSYMSPEQCRGARDIDPRADVYAMGVVIYEMLTCRLPFEGGMGQVLQAHLMTEPTPPSARLATVPPAWDAIVLHCLEKDRDDRFPSMDALAAAIRNPEAHLAAYTAQRAARAARGPHRPKTWVLSPEERPGAPAPAIAASAAELATPPPVPAWLGAQGIAAPEARTMHLTPPRAPDGTPPPFPGLVEAVAANPTPPPAPLATPGPFPAPVPPPTEPTPSPPLAAVLTPAPVPTSGDYYTVPLTGSFPTVPPWRNRALAIAGAAIAAVVIVGTAVWLGRRQRGEAPPETPALVATPADATPALALPDAAAAPAVVPAPPDAAVAAAASDAAAAPIRITIISEPPGAHVTGRSGDDVIDGIAPLTLERPRGAPPLQIQLSLPGRRTVKRTISASRDRDVVIVVPAAPRRPTRAPPDRDRLMRPE